MYAYLVVKIADDGSWADDPNMFDTRGDAVEYVKLQKKPGDNWVMYECREVDLSIWEEDDVPQSP